MFGILAIEFLFFGLFLDKMLLELGTYTLAIDIFNSILVFILLVDFVVKFFFKKNQSMQIAPYLTMPIKKNQLFDFLLRKEFTSIWNWYWMFLVIPFSFKAITPHYGLLMAFLYIIFFYLLCISISLILNQVNILLNKNNWYYILPVAIVVLPFLLIFGLKIDVGDYMQRFGELILNFNLFAWAVSLLIFGLLWWSNRIQMRAEIYNELQGEKANMFGASINLSFLNNFGKMGTLINLDLKMISRSKRLRQQFFVIIFIAAYYVVMLYLRPHMFTHDIFLGLFFTMFLVGFVGLVMGQYLFTSESSFFDGLMTRNVSLYTMLKGKYLSYSAISLFLTLLLMIPAFQGKLDFLLLISIFFYVVGPIYFLIFQNAVYNKSYFDLFDSGAFNWKGTSSNMMVITMLTMFAPLIIVVIINAIFGYNIGCYFMLITGVLFTLGHEFWLKWTYKRFLNRKYKNMEGFRTN